MINAHNSWDKLEEVWLGDVYPASWYNHLPSEVRDCFHELTERTQQDLNIIEQKLTQLGVIVQRPHYDCIDHYIQPDTGVLIKPEITPRDFYVTIDNTLYARPNWGTKSPWQHCLDHYAMDSDCKVEPIMQIQNLHLSGASTVRVGQDLYFDLGASDPGSVAQLINLYQEHFSYKFQDYRVHLLFNGGHVDSCFAVINPGLILATRYFDNYQNTFPDWTTLATSNPEFRNHRRRYYKEVPSNNKWYIPNISGNRAFNQFVLEHAQTWIGDYTETFFEVNCLVIDPKNIMVLGDNETLFRELENKWGFTVHSVPFRTRSFWDGGLHCLTVDIRRQSTKQNYFPKRGSAGIYFYD